jgi:hypothetical protein
MSVSVPAVVTVGTAWSGVRPSLPRAMPKWVTALRRYQAESMTTNGLGTAVGSPVGVSSPVSWSIAYCVTVSSA